MKELNIPIELLLTVDAADGPLSNLMNRSVSSNVMFNINFYQTQASVPFFSHGGPNTGCGMIFNVNLTGPYTNHGNIDEGTMNAAISILNSIR